MEFTKVAQEMLELGEFISCEEWLEEPTAHGETNHDRLMSAASEQIGCGLMDESVYDRWEDYCHDQYVEFVNRYAEETWEKIHQSLKQLCLWM
jgi:hypothetical protein